jgi:hypothetical protein
MAIGEGLDAIRLGRGELMSGGCAAAAITPAGIAGFAAMRALSRRKDDPAAASRPFDADRDGFVMGGAALVRQGTGRLSFELSRSPSRTSMPSALTRIRDAAATPKSQRLDGAN